MRFVPLIIIYFLFICAFSPSVFAQINPNRTGTAAGHAVVNPTKSVKISSGTSKTNRNPKLRERSYPYMDMALPKGNDPAWQIMKAPVRSVSQILKNFEGQSTSLSPSDCNGAVGPNHYVQTVNSTFTVYDKTGNILEAGNLSDFFPASLPGGGGNDGDPIVLYDEDAQRWLLSEFETEEGDEHMLIAISRTSNPTGQWDSYSFKTNSLADYMKFGIWRDGYYMASNTSGASNVYVFERAAMLSSTASPKFIAFDNTLIPTTIDGFHCILPLDNDFALAPAGSPGMFITVNDDAIGGGSDQLWIYECSVNWNTMALSTFSRTQTINVAAFDSNFGPDWSNIMQPNSVELDGIPQVLMFRAQYINFGDHQTIMVCHTVDVNDTDRASIRWYELQKTTGNWGVRQQSTYSPDAISRWMPSISMNMDKEIAIGYSVASASVHPGIRVAGQSATANAAANNMLDVAEKTIYSGTYSQAGTNRWGDYFEMSVDPSNNTDFWYTAQYIQNNSNKGTKIAAFNYTDPCTPPTLDASNFSATEIHENDMTINWSRGNGNAVLIVARQGNVVDLAPQQGTTYSSNSIFGNGSQIGVGNFVVYNGTGNSATISGLTPGTTYYFSFYEYFDANKCYSSTSISGNALTTGFAPCNICSSSGNSLYQTGITLVNFNTLNNSTLTKSSGYTDFSTIITPVVKGTSYNLNVHVNTDGVYTIFANAWIDWNNDCDFDDAGESYILGSADDTPDGITSLCPLSINIPSDATSGIKKMRIAARFNNEVASCDQNYDGEVEDYSLNVISSVPTAPTSNFIASSNSISVGESINFTDYSLELPTSWQWTFEGASPSSSTDQNPQGITYDTPGSYNVTLLVTNAYGNDTKLKTGFIYVAGNPPVADFVANETIIDQGGSIDFTDNSTNSPISWSWVFEGGSPSSSTEQNPSGILYNTIGNFNVTLVSSNENGDGSEIKSNYITVNEPNAISSVTDEESVLLYPNPNNGLFNIEVKTSAYSTLSISVYSSSGQIIGMYGYKNISDGFRRQIDLRRLNKGIYTLKIIKDKKISSRQIIIE